MDSKQKYYLEIADNTLVLSKRLVLLKNASTANTSNVIDDAYLSVLTQFSNAVYQEITKISTQNPIDTSIWLKNRGVKEFFNSLLVEIGTENQTEIEVRQLFVDTFFYLFILESILTNEDFLSEISHQYIKVFNLQMRKVQQYFLTKKTSSAEEKLKIQQAVLHLWKFVPDLFQASTADVLMYSQDKGVNFTRLYNDWENNISTLLGQINIFIPVHKDLGIIGKEGQHTDNFRRLLQL